MSLVKELRAAIVERLENTPNLRGVPVIVRQPGNIQAKIEEGLAAGLGCCLVVFTPRIARVEQNAPGPYFRALKVRVKAIENPLLERPEGAPDAEELIEFIFTALHLWQPRVQDRLMNALFADDPPTTEAAYVFEQREIDALFETSAGFKPQA